MRMSGAMRQHTLGARVAMAPTTGSMRENTMETTGCIVGKVEWRRERGSLVWTRRQIMARGGRDCLLSTMTTFTRDIWMVGEHRETSVTAKGRGTTKGVNAEDIIIAET